MSARTLVLDNGSYQIKAGHVGGDCIHVINALMRSRDRRVWMANDVLQCRDLASLQYRRPIDKGQLYSWELEKAIWDYIFETKTLGDVIPSETTLLLTEAPYTLPQLTTNTDQIILEEYEFAGYRRCAAQELVGWDGPESDAQLVVDCGFQGSICAPIIQGHIQYPATRRLDVGGKVLTNYLKETVSFRYYNMLEESALLSVMKERVCYVAQDFQKELDKWYHDRRQNALGYILPDHIDRTGRVVHDPDEARRIAKGGVQQALVLGNEPFTIPEALFDPRQLGLNQAGLHLAIAEAINSTPVEAQPLLWANIRLAGGTAQLPGLASRLHSELRHLAPEECEIKIYEPPQKIESAWQGGCKLASRSDFNEWIIRRDEYLETGESLCVRKFGRMTSH